ncbi:PEP-CTERM sorting domain-containing protein [Desulfobacter hydrogenophilus]|nr:PEP-CTERM sorting domain-containing protein [Desulfobacter hydrogenophilus]
MGLFFISGDKKMKNIMMMISMLMCMFILSPLANATVIDFTGLEGEVSSPYTENGFTLTAELGDDGTAYFYAIASADESYYYYSGSETLMNDSYTTTILTATDGSMFDLTSIDLAKIYSNDDGSYSAMTITFEAFYADNTIYTYDVTTDGLEGLQTITLGEAFSNLVSVSFGAEYYQFDNITASAVPEPSSILLLFVGMGAWAAGARKKLA